MNVTKLTNDYVADVTACPGGDQDTAWQIEWDFTIAGSQDIQPCPQTQGIQTFGN